MSDSANQPADTPGFVHHAALRTAWHPVAEPDQIGSEPYPVRLLGDDLVLWRDSDDRIVAVPDRCSHRESPLSAGWVIDGAITCPYHGWAFDGGGHCVSVPSSGPDAAIPPAAHIPCISVDERYGLVWVCPGEPAAPIPSIPQDSDPAFRRINTRVEPWAVCGLRMVDNFMDISHFPWVHTGTFGNRQRAEVQKLDLRELPHGYYGYAFEVDAENPDTASSTSRSDADTVHREMTTGFGLPFTVRSTILYDDGLQHILLLCTTPVDDLNSLFTFVVWRNDDHSTDPDEIIAFDLAIGAEDKVMLEKVPGVMPLGRTDLVSVQSDKGSVEWRRQLAEFVSGGPAR